MTTLKTVLLFRGQLQKTRKASVETLIYKLLWLSTIINYVKWKITWSSRKKSLLEPLLHTKVAKTLLPGLVSLIILSFKVRRRA